MLQLAFWTLPWSPVCNLRNTSRSSLSCREVVINLENFLSSTSPLQESLLCPCSYCLDCSALLLACQDLTLALSRKLSLTLHLVQGLSMHFLWTLFFCCAYHVASVCMSFSLQKSETTSLSGLFRVGTQVCKRLLNSSKLR